MGFRRRQVLNRCKLYIHTYMYTSNVRESACERNMEATKLRNKDDMNYDKNMLEKII